MPRKSSFTPEYVAELRERIEGKCFNSYREVEQLCGGLSVYKLRFLGLKPKIRRASTCKGDSKVSDALVNAYWEKVMDPTYYGEARKVHSQSTLSGGSSRVKTGKTLKDYEG